MDLGARLRIVLKPTFLNNINSHQTFSFLFPQHYDKFLELCGKKLKQFYGEDPQRAVDFGRIVSPFHCQRLKVRTDFLHVCIVCTHWMVTTFGQCGYF